MAEEGLGLITCEACGIQTIRVDDVELNEMYRKLDLFICPRCVISWHAIASQLRQFEINAEQQEDLVLVDRLCKDLEKYARNQLLKEHPLPIPHKETKPKDRLDTIIIEENE